MDQHTPLEEVIIFFDTATYDQIERDIKVNSLTKILAFKGNTPCKKSIVFDCPTPPHNGRTVAPEAILFESPCRAHPET